MIKIHGVIGSYKNDKGETVKGIELVDVIAQVEAEKENQVHDFEINSVGGLVTVGYAIADYMASLKKAGKIVNTIGNGVVASIATIPFLEGQKRQIVEGTDFLVHNPYAAVQGDAEQLEQYSKSLAAEEKNMADRYSKATGVSSSAMDLLMKEDKPMAPERAVQLNFATEVITGDLNSEFKNMQIIAALKTTEMKPVTTEGNKILKAIAALASIVSGAVKNLSVTTEDGKALEVAGDELAEGAAVTMDGEPTLDASYTLADGTKFSTDAEGKISSITPAEPVEAKVGDELKDSEGKLVVSDSVELENGATAKTDDKGIITEITPKAEEKAEGVEALEAENTELKATIETMKTEQSETAVKVEALAKMIGSKYKPEDRRTFFATRKPEDKPAEGIKSSVKERRAERAEANA